MNSSRHAQSATSLPRAPRDEVGARSRNYLITMAVRIACILAMVLVTPYGWYTWVFGAVAVFTPYFAVVLANVGSNVAKHQREDPVLQIEPAPRGDAAPAAGPRVIRLDDTRPLGQARESRSPGDDAE